MTTDKKPRKERDRLTEDQKTLHANLRRWTGNPTNRLCLERLIDCMLDYELKYRLRHA